MKTMHNLNLGFSQQTFDFDPFPSRDLEKILGFIDSWIANNDNAMLDDVINQLALQENRSIEDILDSVITLFKDEKIYFLVAGKKFFNENIQSVFPTTNESNLNFLQRREIYSVINTHLSDPDQWKLVEILKPEKVEAPDLLRAQLLGEKQFKTSVGSSQNDICRSLRKHLREWKRNLEKFRKVSGDTQYPGTTEIQDGLTLLRSLLDIHDPFAFIMAFIHAEDRLCNSMDNFKILEHFYQNQIHAWDILLQAVADFKQNHAELEKNADVKNALDRLFTILTDPRPYSRIEEIPVLISIVKPVNDLILEKQIALEKARAIEKIEQMIHKILHALDLKNANRDMRNQALYPLQRIKRKIDTASTMLDIAVYLEEATSEFDDAMDMLF